MHVFVFMLNSLRVMLVAQDKQQCNYQSVISVLYAIPFTRLWDIGKRDRSTSTKINAVIAHRRFCPNLSNQDYGQNYNNRKMVIESTGLKPLWLFFGSSWHLMQHVSNVLVPMACFIQLPPDWVSRL